MTASAQLQPLGPSNVGPFNGEHGKITYPRARLIDSEAYPVLAPGSLPVS
jgi:hypothetical protein